jgi:hypothetical protein
LPIYQTRPNSSERLIFSPFATLSTLMSEPLAVIPDHRRLDVVHVDRLCYSTLPQAAADIGTSLV